MIDAARATTRRRDLGSFLRVRRAALQPLDTGARSVLRRHVPGLRREEVAKLAGISTTWYTWIEQGREINFSPELLDRIGCALQLAADEIDYLKLLASDAPPATCRLDPQIPDALRDLVERHDAAPAYIATPRLDLLIWNDFVREIFAYDERDDALARNIMWRLFFDESRRQLYVDWESAARGSVAVFRHAHARYHGDPHFETLIATMLQHPDFERIWNDWEVLPPGFPPFLIRDRTMGICEVTVIQASLGISPGCYLALFSSKKLS
jgi:transcriptional regulator with XRE-family HTH domain